MFTGIVEELGEVVAVEDLAQASRLTVRGPLVTSDAGHGDSIAVNGVCLTVVSTVSAVGPDWFDISLIPTTLGRTTLGSKGPGDPVNLEVDILAKHVEKLLQANKESA